MPEPMNRIRLLLVDDHILFRQSLCRLLGSEPDFDVVGDCGTTSEACAFASRCHIDVVLLDFDLAGTDARQCMTALWQRGCAGRVLLVTGEMSPDESAAVRRLGASGIFFKHNSPGMLAQAIRLVARGATWFDERAMQLMSEGKELHPEGVERGARSEREEQVLGGVCEGLSNKELGARLGVSESAIKATLQQLFQKTGVRTRGQLVRIALEESFLGTPRQAARTSDGLRPMMPER